MPRVSERKREKIYEQALYYLFSLSPDSAFTSSIATELARDEEFTKLILQEMHKKKLVILVDKNKHGKMYKRRQRWRLSNEAYDAYKKHQHTPNTESQ